MKRLFFAFIVTVTFAVPAIAQDQPESILQEFSYPYLEKLVATAEQNYPKVKMFQARIRAADAVIAKTKWSYLDFLTFSYLYSPNNSITLVNPNLLNGYQFGIYANIGLILEKPAMVKQVKEERQAAIYDKQTNDKALAADVQERYIIYLQQKAILKLRAQTLTDAQSMVSDIKARYERGESTLDDYNKILVSYSEHNQERIITEAAMLMAKNRLEELLGVKLEDIK